MGYLFAIFFAILLLAAMSGSMRRSGHTSRPVGNAGGGKGFGALIALGFVVFVIILAALAGGG